jgi:SAM-dependent methyltransferase
MPTTALRLFRETFPEVMRFLYMNTIRREAAGCQSVLDLGCGPLSPTRLLRFAHATAVEGFAPALEAARSAGTHTEYVLADVRTIGTLFTPKQFDCCIALDLIEHLSREDGIALLRTMESLARRKVILFTPNGFLPQASHEGDLQEHLSGWTPEQMRALGYRVYGMHGHRALRGEEHRHRIRPKVFSGLLSLLTHGVWTGRHPEAASAILCVKEP